MANNTGSAGEYLVASELCRRGFIATTFTRNMPHFDILTEKDNHFLKIQVKTVKTGEWSLDAKAFLEFDEDSWNNGIQKVTGKKRFNSDFFVFVRLGEYGHDSFFIVATNDVIELVRKSYSGYLETKGGRRVRNPKSTHTKLKIKDIEHYANNWDLLEK